MSLRKVGAEEEAAEPEQSEEEEFNGSRLLNRSRLHGAGGFQIVLDCIVPVAPTKRLAAS